VVRDEAEVLVEVWAAGAAVREAVRAADVVGVHEIERGKKGEVFGCESQ